VILVPSRSLARRGPVPATSGFLCVSSSLEASLRVVSLCLRAPGGRLDLSRSSNGDALVLLPSLRRRLKSPVSSSGFDVSGGQGR
jgi:hypothetical protein